MSARRVSEIEAETETTAFGNAKMKLVERALKVASTIDRKNANLKRAYYAAKLERFKYLASTGEDRFYNDSTRKEAFSAFRQVQGWSNRSRDPEVASLQKEYVKQFAERAVPLSYATPAGPQTVGYLPGTGLDETFVKRSIEEEYRTYRDSALQGGGLSGGAAGGSNQRF